MCLDERDEVFNAWVRFDALAAEVGSEAKGDSAVFLLLLSDDGHPGHLCVVSLADLEADLVVASIEVNTDAGVL